MKIICIGRNYAAHIEELGNERPEHPVIFMKPDTALLRNNDAFFYPDFTSDIHFECELVVKINKVGKHIKKEFAGKYYNEIGLGIDFTARDIQSRSKEKGLPWETAKAFDNSAPISQFIAKENYDLTKTTFTLKVNEEIRQQADTSLMLWPVDELITYVSKFFTLKKGDIIFTGTPKGVGPIAIGDRLRGYIGDKQMFDFEIK